MHFTCLVTTWGPSPASECKISRSEKMRTLGDKPWSVGFAAVRWLCGFPMWKIQLEEWDLMLRIPRDGGGWLLIQNDSSRENLIWFPVLFCFSFFPPVLKPPKFSISGIEKYKIQVHHPRISPIKIYVCYYIAKFASTFLNMIKS